MGQKEDKAYAEKILGILDQALTDGPWDKSLFLRATGQKLRDLRRQFIEEAGLTEALATIEHNPQDNILGRFSQRTGQQEIFISLYCAAGDGMVNWERLLVTLDRQNISRPVYTKEQAVKGFIRSKTCREREAYVAVYVNKEDIIPNTEKSTDRLGHELVTLKERAVKLSNIARFVHISGIYILKDNQLIRQSDVQYEDFA